MTLHGSQIPRAMHIAYQYGQKPIHARRSTTRLARLYTVHVDEVDVTVSVYTQHETLFTICDLPPSGWMV